MKHISQILPRVIADIQEQYFAANGGGSGRSAVHPFHIQDDAPPPHINLNMDKNMGTGI